MEYLLLLLKSFITKKKGFNPAKELRKIKKDGDHYSAEAGNLEVKFGASFEAVNPSGQWVDFIPTGEIQRNPHFDTFGCTVYNTENPIQILHKKKYGYFYEYSERYNGVLAGIKINFGGSPHNAAETYRKNGAIPYESLPFDESITTPQQFYSPNPMQKKYLDEGRVWLDKYDFGHDWIWDLSQNSIKNMLKYSPLGIGVYAWQYDSIKAVYTKPNWATDNHWTTLVGYVEGKYWIVFDSYEENGTFLKHLDWNYPFKFAKRYYLSAKTSEAVDSRKRGEEIFNNDIKKKGRKYLLVKPGGGLYEISGFDLIYHFWATDSQTFFQVAVDEYIRKKEREGVLTGISVESFNLVKEYLGNMGGGITVDEKVIEQIKGLLGTLT